MAYSVEKSKFFNIGSIIGIFIGFIFLIAILIADIIPTGNKITFFLFGGVLPLNAIVLFLFSFANISYYFPIFEHIIYTWYTITIPYLLGSYLYTYKEHKLFTLVKFIGIFTTLSLISFYVGSIVQDSVLDYRYDKELNNAINTNNPMSCIHTSDAVINNCFLHFAISNNDPKLCDNMRNKDSTSNCIKSLAINNRNLRICDHLFDSSNPQIVNSCKYEAAINSNNPDFCFLLDFKQTSCIREFLTHEHKDYFNNITVCNKISDSEVANDCRSMIAILHRNIDECPDSQINNCVTEIAVKQRDFRICNNIADNQNCIDRVKSYN